MPPFTGFNLKPRRGESVQVFTEGDHEAMRTLLPDESAKHDNAIETLLKKAESVAVITNVVNGGNKIVGLRVVRKDWAARERK